jgi:thiol-disulfide isomerase/thioredoxin
MSLFHTGRAGSGDLPVEGRLGAFDGAIGWLNSEPLTPAGLRGKVVLVDFWTYTCINWLRTLPYVRAWAERYEDRGLVVVGVHTPEFPFERDVGNVGRAVKDMRIDYPVAIDSDYEVWNAFANRYWPALYLADAEGRLRYQHFGEGRYEESERAIQELLGIDEEPVSAEGDGVEAPADWDELASPETYLGYERGERFASPGGGTADERQAYTAPETLRLNQWALAGEWTIGAESAALHEAGGGIVFRFRARDVHLVLKPPEPGVSARFRVRVDGEAPGAAAGSDLDEQGNGVVSDPRLYQLVRQPGRVQERTFEITFLDPGVRAYVFTFG